MAKFKYISFNNQLSLSDEEVQPLRPLYEAPEGFDTGDRHQAAAFLRFEADHFGYDIPFEILYWDGRTMVVAFDDSMGVNQVTYIFEFADE